MPRRPKKHSSARLVGLLILISLVAVVLPKPFTESLNGILQVLVPLQHAMSAVSPEPQPAAVQLTAREVDQLQRKLNSYENQFAAMKMQISELEQANAELTGLRERGLAAGRLIGATVVAADSLPWRASKLVDRGTLAGIGPGRAVISNHYVAVGEEQGVAEGMSVITAEALVGEVISASPHTARILLITDPASPPRRVRIARKAADGFHVLPVDFMLHGIGDGRMEIRGVSHRHIEEQHITEGDVVLTTADDQRLPVAVVVGRVQSIRRDDDNGVLYNLTVRHAVDGRTLKRVYVVDLGGSS